MSHRAGANRFTGDRRRILAVTLMSLAGREQRCSGYRSTRYLRRLHPGAVSSTALHRADAGQYARRSGPWRHNPAWPYMSKEPPLCTG